MMHYVATNAERASRPWMLVIWIAAVAIAVFLAMILAESADLDGFFVPLGNDSFYHARRLLDAAAGRGFYEFDPRVHAPDGRLVPWPWLYDYSLSLIARAALWLRPGHDPLAVVFFVPVVWVLVNAALLAAITAELGLSLEMRAVALLCFALSPFTQLLHAFGMIDHHYLEHTFVLLTVWLGLRWFRQPDSGRIAAVLGAALGVAPGVHTGLFVLQLLPLCGLFLSWLRGRTPPRGAAISFAIALLVASLSVLWPSATFRAGLFDFGLLSWFHLYVAVCTAGLAFFLCATARSQRTILSLIGIASLAMAPVLEQALRGTAFIAGNTSVLDDIVEAQSIVAQITRSPGLAATLSFYTWLLLLVPVLLAWHVYRLAKEREPARVYYSVAVVLGLTLMMAQFRFHYFGFFALVTGGLVLVDELRMRHGWHRGAVFAVSLLVVVAAYQPALRNRLFQNHLPGIDLTYASTLPLYLRLGRECATDPAVVLATNNDGNPILFHTDCGVITNNFILSKADDDHLRRAGRLLRSTPEEIRRTAPDVGYIVLRTDDFTVADGASTRLLSELPMVRELLMASNVPSGFELVYEVYRGGDGSDADNVYAKLFRVTH